MLSLNAETKLVLKTRLLRLKYWSDEKASTGIAEYEKFLALKAVLKDFNASKLSPPLLIDEIWHLHILDTERYFKDCIEFCGEMIHHNPDIDVSKCAIRRNATKIAYQMQSGTEPTSEMWMFDEVHTTNQEKAHTTNPESAEVASTEVASTEAASTVVASTVVASTVAKRKRTRSKRRRVFTSRRKSYSKKARTGKHDETVQNLSGTIQKSEVAVKKEIFEVNCVQCPDIFTLDINYANRKHFKVEVTGEQSVEGIFTVIKQSLSCTFPVWKVFGKGKTFDIRSEYVTVAQLMFELGTKLFVVPGLLANKPRISKKKLKKEEMCLVPQFYQLPVYYVNVEGFEQIFRVKINKEVTIKEILLALPCDHSRGFWDLAEKTNKSTHNLIENSTMFAILKNWSGQAMKIYVSTVTKSDICLIVMAEMTVRAVRAMIQERNGVPHEQQRLIFAGRQLSEDDRTLSDIKIKDGSVLHFLLRSI